MATCGGNGTVLCVVMTFPPKRSKFNIIPRRVVPSQDVAARVFRYNIPIGIVNVRVGYFVLHQICNREAMRLPLFDWHLVGRQNV